MEKSGLPKSNYPQMPAEMSGTGTGTEANYSGYTAQTAPAPPSYEQATSPTTYPPVQVLPTTPADTQNRPAQHATAPTTNANSPYRNATYGATEMGNGAAGVGAQAYTVPPPQHVYMPHAAAQSQPMVQQPVVIIQQQAILPLGPDPTYITCPACHISKLTRIDYEPSSRTHLMAALLCIVGLWCCVCLPYCSESCMSTNHYCGNCNKFLGTYNAGGF